MATVSTPETIRRLHRLDRIWQERPGVLGWLTTTDHKRIGILYLFTSLAFFAAGGTEALLVRTQLITPNGSTLSPAAFNTTMTMHGVTMIFLFVIPISTGAFGNYLLPLMIGARDMAYPRLNAFSYWVFLGSGLFMYVGVATGNGPNAGWFDYMPLFCYAFLAVSFALVFALPALSVDCLFLELDRRLGFNFFNVGHGGNVLLWQHLFWIFGHPEVYIIILPAFGIATSIIPTFTRRRMVAFPMVALAEILVAFIGFGVWAHHMFSVGLPTITTIYFAAASMIVVIPSAIQLFAWLTTLVTGKPTFTTPLLWIIGFIVFFIIGGLSGIMFAAIPFDQQLTDTYFVVAHFHFIIFGAAVFPLLGGIYYWFPKVTGRMYNEPAGQASFWITALGSALTFFPMHIVGLLGMPRRVYTYPANVGWGPYNLSETIGSYILAAGLVLMVVNLVWSYFRGPASGPNPFGGATLEWSIPSPPPEYNFPVIPTVSSAYPMWDVEDREHDVDKLNRGEMVLDQGHETPASTTLDGYFDEILDMPSNSPWPVVTALMITGVFAMILTGHLVAMSVFLGLFALSVMGWHSVEPREA